MTELVIGHLEIIDVEHDECHRLLRASSHAHHGSLERRAVEHPGQRITRRQFCGLFGLRLSVQETQR